MRTIINALVVLLVLITISLLHGYRVLVLKKELCRHPVAAGAPRACLADAPARVHQ